MTTNGTSGVVVYEASAKPTNVRDARDAYEPRDMSEAFAMAKQLTASGMLPRAIQRPEQALAILITGRELGLSAMQALRSIHIVEGRPTLAADLLVALVKRRTDICEYFSMIELSSTVCTFETKRRGEPNPTRLTWTKIGRAHV